MSFPAAPTSKRKAGQSKCRFVSSVAPDIIGEIPNPKQTNSNSSQFKLQLGQSDVVLRSLLAVWGHESRSLSDSVRDWLGWSRIPLMLILCTSYIYLRYTFCNLRFHIFESLKYIFFLVIPVSPGGTIVSKKEIVESINLFTVSTVSRVSFLRFT